MLLRDFITPERVDLRLEGATKDEVLASLADLLGVDGSSRQILLRTLRRREGLGSTGIGKGVAVPHCRSRAASALQLAYGRHPDGVEFDAVDGLPVAHFFLIVAPPVAVAGQYLPVLGKVARFAKDPEVPRRLAEVGSPEELFGLMATKGV